MIFWIIILSPFVLCVESVDYGPSNQAVVARDNVTMECGTDTNCSLQWKHRQGSEEAILSYRQIINSSRSTLNISTSGQYDLHIWNADRIDAGSYICIQEEKSELSNQSVISKLYEAQLVILNSKPSCSMNASNVNWTVDEDDFVQMSGNVAYVGNLNATMEWRRDEVIIKNVTNTSAQTTKTIKSSLQLQVTASDNGSHFSCVTYFQPLNSNTSHDDNIIRAINAPSYNHRWTSPPLNVQYRPRNITIKVVNQNASFVKSGDSLQCNADGNPIPTYEWTIITSSSNITVNGSLLRINNSMINNSFTFTTECKAKNIKGENTTTVNFNVTAERNYEETASTDNPNKNFPHRVFFSIIIPVGIILAVILAVIIIRRCIAANKDNTDNLVIQMQSQNDLSFYSFAGVTARESTVPFQSLAGTEVVYEEICNNDGYSKAHSELENNCKGFTPSQNNLGAIYEEVKSEEVVSHVVTGNNNYNHAYAEAQISGYNGKPQDTLYNDQHVNDHKRQIVGADGVVYSEVSKVPENSSIYHLEGVPKRPLFQKSAYMEVDHTRKVPPAPPNSKSP